MLKIEFVALDEQLVTSLDEIKDAIQNSEQLQNYLESEEQDDFDILRAAVEPAIHELYVQVSTELPTQLIAFEKYLLDEGFEGIYVGKILNYAVLRASLNDDYKFNVFQDHIQEIILTIANSVNFEVLKKYTKQGLQASFAFGTDVWVTNLLSEVTGKKVSEYLLSLKPQKKDYFAQRKSLSVSMKRQFNELSVYSFGAPKDLPTFVQYSKDITFNLKTKLEKGENADIFAPIVTEILANPAFELDNAYVSLLTIAALSIQFEDDQVELIQKLSTKVLAKPSAVDLFYHSLVTVLENKKLLNPTAVANLNQVFSGDTNEYAAIINTIHKIFEQGFEDEEILTVTVDHLKSFGDLDIQGEIIRDAVRYDFNNKVKALPSTKYVAFFDLFKIIEKYIVAFDNQKFTNDVKNITLYQVSEYIRLLTNRRSQEYQEVKNFLSSTLVNLGFLAEKEVKEMLKKK